MKPIIATLALLTTLIMPALADGGDTQRNGQRKYALVVAPETDPSTLAKTNDSLRALQQSNAEKAQANSTEQRGLLSSLLYNFALTAQTRTVASTDAIAQLLVQSAQTKRQKWLQAAQQQCHFQNVIKEAAKVDDFYWLPSSQGALDPSYIRFKGFGCRSYIECTGCEQCQPKPGEQAQDTNSIHGSDVFYVWCSLRTDSAGIAAMVNHSKFLVQVDTFAFRPARCELPCDSTGNQAIQFSFANRKDLNISLSTTFYSSWVNEAIMVTNDQPLGTFTIHAAIDSTQLNPDGVYTYSRRHPNGNQVDIEGDCFLVPRSYTGTLDGTTHNPAWGTGQYRIEMTLEESCQLNMDYYYETTEALTDPDSLGASRQENRKWDKDKWKTEWKAMQAHKQDGFWRQAAQVVEVQMIGNSWVTTVTAPVLTTLSESETEWLERVLGTGESSTGVLLGM